jgi:hypothetical protein
VIQLTLLVAVHGQLEPVMIETLPLLPVEGTETVVGETEYPQLPKPCEIVTVWPAMVSVPVRGPPEELLATV